MPIYGPDPANGAFIQSGNSSLSIPVGSTVYGGPLLQGASYTFEVLAGPAGGPMVSVAKTTFLTAEGNTLPAGLVQGGIAIVPGVATYQPAQFQIRVWENYGLGAWDTAGARAESPIITLPWLGANDPATGTFIPIPKTVGWSSFNIWYIPEPSTWALTSLGLGVLWLSRRRRSNPSENQAFNRRQS